METVMGLVANKPVVIFGKSSCCMTHTVKSLISSFGANPTVYELDQVPNGQQLETALKQQQSSLPVVYIGQVLIGGNREVNSLHLRNELVPLLIRANAIWPGLSLTRQFLHACIFLMRANQLGSNKYCGLFEIIESF